MERSATFKFVLSCFSRIKFEEQDNIKILFSQKLKYCFFSTPSFGYDKVHLVFNRLIVRFEYWQFNMSLSKPCDVFVRHYDLDKYKNKIDYMFYILWSYVLFGLTFKIIKKQVYFVKVKSNMYMLTRRQILIMNLYHQEWMSWI